MGVAWPAGPFCTRRLNPLDHTGAWVGAARAADCELETLPCENAVVSLLPGTEAFIYSNAGRSMVRLRGIESSQM